MQVCHPFTNQILQPTNIFGKSWAQEYKKTLRQVHKIWLNFGALCAALFSLGFAYYCQPNDNTIIVYGALALPFIFRSSDIFHLANRISDLHHTFDMNDFQVVESH